jgi:hypothetical protein
MGLMLMLRPDGSAYYADPVPQPLPETRRVMHIGGPIDGYDMPVQLGPDGNLPDFYTHNYMGPMVASRDPIGEIMFDTVHAFYALEMTIENGRVDWAYRYGGETIVNRNPRNRAA